jgi:hypothetical protein
MGMIIIMIRKLHEQDRGCILTWFFQHSTDYSIDRPHNSLTSYKPVFSHPEIHQPVTLDIASMELIKTSISGPPFVPTLNDSISLSVFTDLHCHGFVWTIFTNKKCSAPNTVSESQKAYIGCPSLCHQHCTGPESL